MTKDKALDLALEIMYNQGDVGVDEWLATEAAIKQARSAPVQEPVGEVNRYGLDSHGRKWHGIYWYDPNVDVAHGTKLYTTPPAAQRQWVGLTDAEVMQTMSGDWTSQFYFARAIEAKLKEKNSD